MSNQSLPSARLRLPAFALLASLLAFIAGIGVTVGLILTRFPEGLDPATSRQLAASAVDYIVFHLVFLVAVSLGVGGLAALANVLRGTDARLLAWVTLASALVAIAVNLLLTIVRLTLIGGFEEATLGQNDTFQWTSWAFDNVLSPLLAFPTLVASIALFTTGILRRTGLVVGILSGILFVLAFVTGYPPFVFAFLWLALGIGLLRRKESGVR